MQRDILIIEDNRELADLLRLHLTDHAWDVTQAFEGDRGFKTALSGRFGLIILDIMLPGMDGIELLRGLRENNVQTPVLMLTSKASEVDRILGLELGADDYVTKPFSIRELIARIKAIFRRIDTVRAAAGEPGEPILSFGELIIDPQKRQVTKNSRPIELTAREFDLLLFFARHPGRVFNRNQLLDRVWGYGHDGYSHTVNSNINRLRAKIETRPHHPAYILTVWGVGYKFREVPTGEAPAGEEATRV